MRCNFIKYCETQIEPFVLNDEELDIYQNFGRYLVGDKSIFDNDKGIFIIGVVGCGKTTLFKMAQRFQEKQRALYFTNAETLIRKFEEGEEMSKYLKNEWCFDDLGTEQKANNYGKGIEIFKRLIEERYDKWKYEGIRTHFTTNCGKDELMERYGDRAYDRLKEMCNSLKHPFIKSKRGISKIKPLQEIPGVQMKHRPMEFMMYNNEKEEYYEEKKRRVLSLFKDSLAQDTNLFEKISKEEAETLFDAYKHMVWSGGETDRDLWKICGIIREDLEDSEVWRESLEVVRKYNIENGRPLQTLINNLIKGDDRILIMRVVKQKLLVQMMFDKMI